MKLKVLALVMALVGHRGKPATWSYAFCKYEMVYHHRRHAFEALMAQPGRY